MARFGRGGLYYLASAVLVAGCMWWMVMPAPVAELPPVPRAHHTPPAAPSPLPPPTSSPPDMALVAAVLDRRGYVSAFAEARCLGMHVVDLLRDVRYDELDKLAQSLLFNGWVAAYPRSAASHEARATFLTNWAWEARGGGYADSVTDRGWTLFHDRLARARQDLVQASQLHPDDHYYDQLVTVTMGEGGEKQDFYRIFDQASAHNPLCLEVAPAVARALMPRWHGQPGDCEKFAAHAAERTSKQAGQALYAWVGAELAAESPDDFFSEYGFKWARMRQGFLDLRRLYPRSRAALNSFARIACAAGDRKTAQPLLKQLAPPYEPHLWGGAEGVEAWRRWAAGRGPKPN